MPSIMPKIPYNLAVIGGGVTGVAIAVDAVMRGLSVLLVEKNTLGHGTSSKTSKLAHGGLRYLEQLEFSLVHESLRERNLLLKNAPDFVHPLPFIVPIYKKGPWSPFKLSIGLSLYDFLAGKKEMPSHTNLTKDQILERIPGLKSESLQKGFQYYDAQMDDLGIVQSLGALAKSHGVTLLEHSEAELLYEKTKLVGITVRQNQTDTIYRADKVIQATGPWSNALLSTDNPQAQFTVTPSKGVHIVLPSIGIHEALLLSTPQDNRVFFVIPWKGQTLVGTTDTDYHGDPDTVSVTSEDSDYLLAAYNFYFPDKPQSQADILDSFVGLRPLFNFKQSAQSPSEKSRDFQVIESPSGLFTIIGGKFTTHRAMAEAAVDKICKRLPNKPWKTCQTKEIFYPKL